jgi:hypothetical protein
MQARRENLRRGSRSLERQKERLTEAYLKEVIPLAEYERRRRDLEQRQEALDEQARQMERQVKRTVELAGVMASIDDFTARIRQGLDNADFEQKRQLVELLIDRVVPLRDGKDLGPRVLDHLRLPHRGRRPRLLGFLELGRERRGLNVAEKFSRPGLVESPQDVRRARQDSDPRARLSVGFGPPDLLLQRAQGQGLSELEFAPGLHRRVTLIARSGLAPGVRLCDLRYRRRRDESERQGKF